MPEKPIGIMEGAYFVGRTQLLNWINDFFKIKYDKIEQVASGALHCQIMDALYPGKVPLHKVNFNAKFDYEYIKNYKILQEVFREQGITKMIEVNKLIKGKYQDNLEFLQWMKRFFDTHWNGTAYDAEQRRNEAIQLYEKDKKWTSAGAKKSRKVSSTTSALKKQIAKETPGKENTPAPNQPVQVKQEDPNRDAREAKLLKENADHAKKIQAQEKKLVEQERIISQLRQNIAELNLQVDNLEKERNFYFEKLRDIEILCDESDPNDPFVKSIQSILYATTDDFVSASEGETVSTSSPEDNSKSAKPQ